MDSELKKIFGMLAIIICIIGVIFFLIIGPKGCDRQISSWSADAYGSDWLVIQYSQDGSIINHWELKDKSIGSETNSDGIYFTDNEDNVVHLSGHYVYIQIKKSPEEVIKKYLRDKK